LPASPDARLVARDPYLPGLATVLDTRRLSERLAPRVAKRTGTATLRLTTNYVCYEPATSCLVGYDLRVGGGRVSLYAKALRKPGDLAVASLPGSGYLRLEDDSIVVAVFPIDAKLPGLPYLLDPKRSRSFLRSVLDRRRGAPAEEVETHTLAYRPECRYVCALETGGRVRAVLKVSRPGALPAAAAREIAAAVHRKGGGNVALPVVPLEIAASRRRGWIAFDWIEGRVLDEVLAGAAPVSQVVEAVGAALAEFHGMVPGGRSREAVGGRTGARAEMERLVRLAAWLYPEDVDRAVRLASRIEGGLGTGVPVPIHGDFHPKHVLIGDRIGFLDLDRARPGSPARDIARFLAHLVRDCLRGTLPLDRAQAAAAAFLDGYVRRARSLPEDLAAHRALAILGLWADPFLKRDPAWDRRAAELLREAERCLEGRVPRPPQASRSAARRKFVNPSS